LLAFTQVTPPGDSFGDFGAGPWPTTPGRPGCDGALICFDALLPLGDQACEALKPAGGGQPQRI